jgi:hypothetical protein
MIYSYIGATYRLSWHSYFFSYHISNTDYKLWRNLAANWHSKVPYKILQGEKYSHHYLFKFLALKYSVPLNYEAFEFPSVLYVDVILLYLLNTKFNTHAYFL